MKDKKDVAQLSAFAIYNNLIPGVRSYQDTSEPTLKKRKKKNKKKVNVVEDAKTKIAVASSVPNQNDEQRTKPKPVPISTTTMESTIENGTAKNKKARKRKRKNQASDPVRNDDNDAIKRSKVQIKQVNSAQPPVAKVTVTPKLVRNPLHKEDEDVARKKAINVNSRNNKQSIDHDQKVRSMKTLNSEQESNKKIIKSPVKKPIQNQFANGDLNDYIQKSTKQIMPMQTKRSDKSESKNNDTYDGNQKVASLLNRKPVWDSIEHGKSLFEWLISPISVETFMNEYWEKKPLHIKRSTHASDYYQWILSSEKLDHVFRTNVLKYQKNVDITSYSKSNNKRETPSDELEGRVRPAVIWDYYNNGCSIRILNPQTYVKPLWRLNASLQEFLGSFVGANAYLTPPDSQGFAPHYDDIEAFIVQVEGKKHWKLYKPRSKDEQLPRFSSQNFSEDKDNIGDPILDVMVEEGDLLYFPRGTIHQAMASEDVHSLHITLSCQQKNTWGDLLKEHLNNVIDKAMASDVEFRRGLPTDYLSYMGIAHQDRQEVAISDKRKKFQKTVKRLVDKVVNTPADFAADQMGKKYVWDSLPPYITNKEKAVTVHEDGEFIQNGVVLNRCEMDPDIEIKLIRKNCIRLVVEEGSVRLYFTTENSLTYHEEEAQFLEMSAKTAPAVQYLIRRYPEFVKIDDLPISTNDISEKVQVAADLWERGLITTKTPLETADGDGSFDSDEAESIDEDDTDNDSDEELEEVESDGDDEMGGFLETSESEDEEHQWFGGSNSEDSNASDMESGDSVEEYDVSPDSFIEELQDSD